MLRGIVSSLTGNLVLPKDIIFCDVTLREGEQTPGVSFSLEEKLELIKRLDDFGIQQLQLPRPGLKKELLDLCTTICKMPLNCKTEIMTQATNANWQDLIEAAKQCNPDIIHGGFRITGFNKDNWDEEAKSQMLDHIVEVTKYIKATGKIVSISLTDATRADYDFFLHCVEAAAKSGADRIRLADTFGVGTPDVLATLVANAVRIAAPYGTIIGAHIHNDFGLALANALACLKNGAKMLDLCANGLGDRAGNACLFQTAIALEGLYKQTTGLKLEQTTELARFVEKITGIPIPATSPFIGRNVYYESSAKHAIEQFTCPIKGRSIIPADIGGKLGVFYGKQTNEAVIELAAKKAGKAIAPKLYPAILAKLKTRSGAQKGIPLTESDFWQIVEQVTKAWEG